MRGAGKISREAKAVVCRDYISGVPSTALARQHNVTLGAIWGILVRRGIPIRPLNTRHKHRRLEVNESAFDQINEASAYWIGFLMADGCILEPRTGQNTIALSLAVRDRAHVEAFKTFLGAAHSVRIHRRAATIRVSSDHLVQAVSRYGVLPRKSLTTRVVHLENNRHFWRGVVDGDGSISDGSINNRRLYLVGSAPLLDQFWVFVHQITGSQFYRPRLHKSGSVSTVTVTGRNAALVADRLYQKAAICLPRKAAKAAALIDKYWLTFS